MFDALIIGSGFGGSMAAWELCRSGARVAMVERGGWVERGPANWDREGTYSLTPHYDPETSYEVRSGRRRKHLAACSCVGGPSVFYGGVSLRFRERDFLPDPDFSNGAAWPFPYSELEPWYGLAERLLHVAGEPGGDPTEPPRSTPYPFPLPPLAEASEQIAVAAVSLGLHPSRLPLAINYADQSAGGCVSCTTCDCFACAIGAKNDLATRILPDLIGAGLELRDGTVATRLLVERGRVIGAECVDRRDGRRYELRARVVLLGAGAIATARLLLASGLDGGGVVGRYLMRHCSGIVYGLFPGRAHWSRRFHKQLAINDYYFGDPTLGEPGGRLGMIQQVSTPPVALVRASLPSLLGHVASRLTRLATGLLVLAEDQPVRQNRVVIHDQRRDSFGVPRAVVEHTYTSRDLSARRALYRRARRVLKRAGARAFYVHRIDTFSHAVGTARMGEDPHTSALDPSGQLRGVQGLYVVDGSVMPTSAGVNPSLTIAAGALRIAGGITGGRPEPAPATFR